MIQPTFLYGSEFWTLSQRATDKVNKFKKKYYEWYLTALMRMVSVELRQTMNQNNYFKEPNLVIVICIRRLQWAWNVHRMHFENTKGNYECYLKGKDPIVDLGTGGKCSQRGCESVASDQKFETNGR